MLAKSGKPLRWASISLTLPNLTPLQNDCSNSSRFSHSSKKISREALATPKKRSTSWRKLCPCSVTIHPGPLPTTPPKFILFFAAMAMPSRMFSRRCPAPSMCSATKRRGARRSPRLHTARRQARRPNVTVVVCVEAAPAVEKETVNVLVVDDVSRAVDDGVKSVGVVAAVVAFAVAASLKHASKSASWLLCSLCRSIQLLKSRAAPMLSTQLGFSSDATYAKWLGEVTKMCARAMCDHGSIKSLPSRCSLMFRARKPSNAEAFQNGHVELQTWISAVG
mmetsp:Transcript_16793/g.43343  ORF Transcript_16793/g.43343 Transcript_16793/m.43343 type:complete len:279 (+) Transcript_16793:820-1656(+)